MKKLGLATIVAGAMGAAVLGVAAPAQADPVTDPIYVLSEAGYPTGVDHRTWLDQIGPHVIVPQVDTTVHQSH